MDEKSLPKLDLSKVEVGFPEIRVPKLDVERMMAPVIKANKEKLEREKMMVVLLKQLVEKPEVRNQISTLIQNSNIQNMQNNYGNSTGVQNISVNTGMTDLEYRKLKDDIRELYSLFNGETPKETEEILEQLDMELQQQTPKTGIIKASLRYLHTLANEVIADPLKILAKKQFADFAYQKAPIVKEGLERLISFFES